MDIARATVVGVALLLLASLPCVIGWVIVNVDTAADRAGRTVARWRPNAHRPEELAARLRLVATALEESSLVEVERRAELTGRYDALLRQTCIALDIEQFLDRLNGSDLVIERLRVEGELESVGLVLRERTGKDTGAERER